MRLVVFYAMLATKALSRLWIDERDKRNNPKTKQYLIKIKQCKTQHNFSFKLYGVSLL